MPIKESLLLGATLVAGVLGESSGSKHSDLTDFKRFTFPFSSHFLLFFYFANDGKLYRNLS